MVYTVVAKKHFSSIPLTTQLHNIVVFSFICAVMENNLVLTPPPFHGKLLPIIIEER